jgi:hypothetical protein
MYAKMRAPLPEDLRVWQVTVDRSTLGSVLDLSADARWAQFINEPLVPGSRNPNLLKSRLFFLRTQNELYGQYFEEFLKVNNLDIKTYDAVVGPEYVRGGKQICLLNKNGIPTPLQERIRGLLRPEEWAKRLTKVLSGQTLPAEEEPIAPKASFPKAIGGLIVSVGLSLLISYISAKLMARINESIIKQRLMLIEPELLSYKFARMIVILDSLSDGHQAFLTSETEYTYMHAPSMSTDAVSYIDSPPMVHLASLSITFQDRSSVVHTTDTPWLGGGTWSDVFTVWASAEVILSKAAIDQYREVQKQLKWYNDMINGHKLAQIDRPRVTSERAELERWIDKAYGKFSDFVPTRRLWTDDGYAQITGT